MALQPVGDAADPAYWDSIIAPVTADDAAAIRLAGRPMDRLLEAIRLGDHPAFQPDPGRDRRLLNVANAALMAGVLEQPGGHDRFIKRVATVFGQAPMRSFETFVRELEFGRPLGGNPAMAAQDARRLAEGLLASARVANGTITDRLLASPYSPVFDRYLYDDRQNRLLKNESRLSLAAARLAGMARYFRDLADDIDATLTPGYADFSALRDVMVHGRRQHPGTIRRALDLGDPGRVTAMLDTGGPTLAGARILAVNQYNLHTGFLYLVDDYIHDPGTVAMDGPEQAAAVASQAIRLADGLVASARLLDAVVADATAALPFNPMETDYAVHVSRIMHSLYDERRSHDRSAADLITMAGYYRYGATAIQAHLDAMPTPAARM